MVAVMKARATERAGGVQRQEARADRSKSHEATALRDGAGGGGELTAIHVSIGDTDTLSRQQKLENDTAHAGPIDAREFVKELAQCSEAGGLLRSTLNPEP